MATITPSENAQLRERIYNLFNLCAEVISSFYESRDSEALSVLAKNLLTLHTFAEKAKTDLAQKQLIQDSLTQLQEHVNECGIDVEFLSLVDELSTLTKDFEADDVVCDGYTDFDENEQDLTGRLKKDIEAQVKRAAN